MILILLLMSYAIIFGIALANAGKRSHVIFSGASSGSRPTRILIVGATGGTGRHLITQALERGYTVTALVRNPSRLRVDHPNLAVVQGDVLDCDSVDAAMRGHEAVVSALGHKQFYKPTRVLSRGTQNILGAMEAHGVTRLVCETSLGIGDSVGRMGLYYTFLTIPLILPFYFWDKTRQENIIAKSHAEWVIVRPGVLNNGTKRGHVRHGSVGSLLWTVRVSRAVADFMLDQLTSDTYLRATPGVAW